MPARKISSDQFLKKLLGKSDIVSGFIQNTAGFPNNHAADINQFGVDFFFAPGNNYDIVLPVEKLKAVGFTSYSGNTVSYTHLNISSKVSVEVLAEQQSMSVSAFSKKFKEKTAMTPVQYINQRRIEKVKQYLKKQEYTLSEIAEITGFSNENYMVRVFKKMTGKTISDYRKKVEK